MTFLPTLRPTVVRSPCHLIASGHSERPLSPAALNIASLLPRGADPCGSTTFGLPLSENPISQLRFGWTIR